MITKIDQIMAKLTLEEKASLCSGINNWETTPIKRLEIPAVMMADGPHGVRKRSNRRPSPIYSRPVFRQHVFPPRSLWPAPGIPIWSGRLVVLLPKNASIKVYRRSWGGRGG